MNVFHISPLIQQNPNFKGIMMLKGILFHFKYKEKLASVTVSLWISNYLLLIFKYKASGFTN